MTTPGFSPRAGLWDWRDLTQNVLYCKTTAWTAWPGEKAIHATGTQRRSLWNSYADSFPCSIEKNVLIFNVVLRAEAERERTDASHTGVFPVCARYISMCTMYCYFPTSPSGYGNAAFLIQHIHRMEAKLILFQLLNFYCSFLHLKKK